MLAWPWGLLVEPPLTKTKHGTLGRCPVLICAGASYCVSVGSQAQLVRKAHRTQASSTTNALVGLRIAREVRGLVSIRIVALAGGKTRLKVAKEKEDRDEPGHHGKWTAQRLERMDM